MYTTGLQLFTVKYFYGYIMIEYTVESDDATSYSYIALNCSQNPHVETWFSVEVMDVSLGYK